MKTKEIMYTSFLVIIVLGLFVADYLANKFVLCADEVYQVYLDGSVIGYIESDQELYELINKKQNTIKNSYGVENVYPPESFNIIKTNAYDIQISSAETIYNRMAKLDSFTVQGYAITIKKEKESTVINVIDKDIFDSSINTFILAFISEDEYKNYMDGTQKEIETIGTIIEEMFFEETITIKKGFIGVNDKIYTDETELSQFLLFGKDNKITKYTVKQGDTIESIAEKNKLNAEEFLIANPQFTSKDSLLKLGEKVNVTLINPVITFVYKVFEVSDAEIPYEKITKYDYSKSPDFSEVTTSGVTGITRITDRHDVKNGEIQTGFDIISQEKITEKVDQITTKGGNAWSPITGEYEDTGETWGWPTNQPSILTSGYEWRWGTFHDGIDISGTGYGSPIYAVLDGTVINAQQGGLGGWSVGYCVVIMHDNGYSTLYAHLKPGSILVKNGERVKRGQQIAGMGNTGYVVPAPSEWDPTAGTHLHFALFKGIAYGGGYSLNPFSLWN